MSYSLPITDVEAADLTNYFRGSTLIEGRFTIIEVDGFHWITDGGDVYVIERQPNGRLLLEDPPGMAVPTRVRAAGRDVLAEVGKR